MLEKIQETAAFLKGKMHTSPETAIILGTGLGSLANEITEKYEIKYEDIPNFPVSTVEGHSGKLIFGKLGNKEIMAMQGRFHYYEGYSMKEVTFPVRVMRELGIKTLFVSNASGGTNPEFEIGDLMIITDHINYFPEHPLRGKNIPYGPRFPDMSEAYDKELIRKADAIAAEKGIKVQHGIYIGTQGPTFETPAEYKLFHILGADAVGMSTVPEVIVANHCGIKVFGISVITDLGVEGKIVEVSYEEVQKAADSAQPKMTTIMATMLSISSAAIILRRNCWRILFESLKSGESACLLLVDMFESAFQGRSSEYCKLMASICIHVRWGGTNSTATFCGAPVESIITDMNRLVFMRFYARHSQLRQTTRFLSFINRPKKSGPPVLSNSSHPPTNKQCGVSF